MGGMPKSAFSANAQAKVCAAAVATLLAGETPAEPRLINTCYSLVAPDYGITVAGVYKPTERPARRHPGRGRRQPGRCAARGARARGAIRRRLVQDDHGRGVRLKRLAIPAGCCCSARRLRRRRTRCGPTRSSATRSRPRSPARRATPERGQKIVTNRQVGLCLLCHSGPYPQERFQGTMAPDLKGAGSRSTEGQLRLRIVDAKPDQSGHHHAALLPGGWSRPGWRPAFRGKPILTAEQIEDVVAYLMTLKD